MDELEVLKKILNNTFHLIINMSDTFYYACSDTSDITGDDILDILPYYNKYGFDSLVAYEAIKRFEDPSIKKHCTDRYFDVKSELIEMMDKNEDFLVDLNMDYRKAKKEIAEFGSRLVYETTKNIIKDEKYSCYEVICYPMERKDLCGSGSCMRDALEDLRKKLLESK